MEVSKNTNTTIGPLVFLVLVIGVFISVTLLVPLLFFWWAIAVIYKPLGTLDSFIIKLWRKSKQWLN